MDLQKIEQDITTLRAFETLTDAERIEFLKRFKTLKLLTPDKANAKTAKSMGKGYASYIMHLAPAKLSGYNMCPRASAGCIAACLNTAGRGRFTYTQVCRVRKTLLWVKARDWFMQKLFREIATAERKAKREGLTLAVRLNGTSDLPFEFLPLNGKSVFKTFPDVQFYDYTKVLARLERLKTMNLTNYHVTFSRSEDNDIEAWSALQLGFNVAVVFDKIPTELKGVKVVNGDAHDLRFLDEGNGVVVALKAKGKAKRDDTGFVVNWLGKAA